MDFIQRLKQLLLYFKSFSDNGGHCIGFKNISLIFVSLLTLSRNLVKV